MAWIGFIASMLFAAWLGFAAFGVFFIQGLGGFRWQETTASLVLLAASVACFWAAFANAPFAIMVTP